MERFTPYRIDHARLEKATVRMRKLEIDFFSLAPPETEVEVSAKALLSAMPISSSPTPGRWTTSGGQFVLEGEHHALDPKTPAGSILKAMASYADHRKQLDSDTRHLPGEFDFFYFAQSERMPESSRYRHFFFDRFGRMLIVLDAEETDDAASFLIPAGEWRAGDLATFEVQLSRALRISPPANDQRNREAGPSLLVGLTLDERLDDWLPTSLAAYQTFLREEPWAASAFAIELVTDPEHRFSASRSQTGELVAAERQRLLTLLCLPIEGATWVRTIQSDARQAHAQQSATEQNLVLQALLRQQNRLLLAIVVLVLVGSVAAWVLE